MYWYKIAIELIKKNAIIFGTKEKNCLNINMLSLSTKNVSRFMEKTRRGMTWADLKLELFGNQKP